MNTDLEALLNRVRSGQIGPEDQRALERALTQDVMVPGARNRAAYGVHLRHHSNTGVYVHTDLNDFGQINKAYGEDAGDEALKRAGHILTEAAKPGAGRVFRKGGDEFTAWFLRPEDAELYAATVKQHLDGQEPIGKHRLSASMGIGRGREQAEAAQRRAKAQLGNVDPLTGHRVPNHEVGQAPTVIESALTEPQPLGWVPAEDRLTKLRLNPQQQADTITIPGVTKVDVDYPLAVKHVAPQDHQDSVKPLNKAEVPPHPVTHGGRSFVMMSGESPRFEHTKTGHDALGKELENRGLQHEEIQGFYGGPEKSRIAYDMPLDDARQLAKEFGQESFIYSDGKNPNLVFANGTMADHAHPAKDVKVSDKPFDDYYSVLHAGGKPTYVQMDMDWSKTVPVRQLKPSGSHPNAYHWHDDKHGSEAQDHEELTKATNDQAAGAGVKTFGPTVAPWGQVSPGTQSSLKFYDYRPFEKQIDELAAKKGYRFYMAGGKNGMPDLGKKNYNTGDLMVWDPEAGSGGDFGDTAYTRSWRKIHELAHAETYGDINAKYGEGRRIGKLGHHRTPNEAKRAVEWEHMVAHKQRELGAQLGHHISDQDFNKEYNTIMADATHRAIHGTFTEPSDEGFVPHDHAVPLQSAFDAIDHHAKSMGLGPDDTLKTVKAKQAAAAVQPAVAPQPAA